jgi:glycosyltransferase involved in cell wall biosynthesis
LIDKMKILVITAFYPPHSGGGFGLRCRDVVEGLRQRGHTLYVLTNRCTIEGCQGHENEADTLRMLYLKPAGENALRQIAFDRRELRKLKKVIDEVMPDIIYLWHLQNLSNAILPWLSSLSIPLVFDDGGSELIYLSRLQKRGLYFYPNERDPALKRWLKQLIKRFARLISGGMIRPDWQWSQDMLVYFNSRSALENARAHGVPVESAAVIPSGLDVARFPFKETPQIHSPVRILLPARIKEQKGCLDGVFLVEELRRRGVPAHLLILGEVQSAEYHALLLQKINELDLSGQVEIRPMVDQMEMSRLYREYDFCFFPSYFKTGFSRVPLEAMSSGCLVLTYGNEGSNESILNLETGFLFREGDIVAMADQVEILRSDRGIFEKIAANGRKQVENFYSMQKYLGMIETILLERSKPAK